jgi:predicted ferric reductase
MQLSRRWVSDLRRSSATRPAQPPEPSGGFGIAGIAGVAAGLMAIVGVATLLGRSVSPLTWYLTRASGFTLYLLLWFSVTMGLGITTKLFDRFAARSVIYSVHTFVTQLSYGFLALHLLSLLADTHVSFSIGKLLVPFASETAEPWTGLGVLAMYLLIIIGVSGFLRRFISFKVWRVLHMLAFPLFLQALAHGIGTGSDSESIWALSLYLTTGLSVLWLVVYRLLRRNRRAETAIASPSAPPLDRFAPQTRGRQPGI